MKKHSNTRNGFHEIPIHPEDLRRRGIDRPDVLLISGDAFCDHPSFGPAVVARLLESFGLDVAVAAQPDPRDFQALAAFGQPRLFVGITAGNMDSMVNHYTALRKKRRTDLYSPGGRAGLRPDRATIRYANLARRAFADNIIVLGGIEASMRRFAHYDYWQEAIRKSVLLDAKADLLVYGMAERQLRAIVDRLSVLTVPHRGHASVLRGIRGTVFALSDRQAQEMGICLEDASSIDPADLTAKSSSQTQPPSTDRELDDKAKTKSTGSIGSTNPSVGIDDKGGLFRAPPESGPWRVRFVPSFEEISRDITLLARASHVVSRATNPFLGEVLVQRHDRRLVVAMPPALPLTTRELDLVHELPYSRRSHSSYEEPIPAMDRMKGSIQINRGCFGGCTFCAIAAHQGRDIQSRSADSILREVSLVASTNKGLVSDLGGPTANTWGMHGKDQATCRRCRKPSCLFPRICPNLDSDQGSLRRLLAKVRALPGLRKAIISSGLRHDLALQDPRYLEELMTHHVGGHLHVAPEHNDPRVLRLAKKPGYEVFEKFRHLFDKIKSRRDLHCYLNPYFVSGLPGSTDERMENLTKLLRSEGWKPRQVQSFIPTPGTPATAMFAAGVNPEDPEDRVEMPRTLADKIRQHRILTRDVPRTRPRARHGEAISSSTAEQSPRTWLPTNQKKGNRHSPESKRRAGAKTSRRRGKSSKKSRS